MKKDVASFLFDVWTVILGALVYAPAIAFLVWGFQTLAGSVSIPVLALLAVPLAYASGLAFIAGLTILLLVLPAPREGRYPFPFSYGAGVWTLRLVILRLVFAPGIRHLFFCTIGLRYLLLRALGARVPLSFLMSSDASVTDPSFLEVGREVMLGGESLVSGHYIDNGELVLTKTRIGDRTQVFIKSVIFPGCTIGRDVTIGLENRIAYGVTIGDSSYLGMQVVVGPGTRIGENCVIGHRVFIGANVVIEDHAILKTGAIIPSKTRIACEPYRVPR